MILYRIARKFRGEILRNGYHKVSVGLISRIDALGRVPGIGLADHASYRLICSARLMKHYRAKPSALAANAVHILPRLSRMFVHREKQCMHV